MQPALDDQWNLTIQHQFWGDTTFQIGYVGQRGTHLMVPFDYAQRVLNSDGTTSPSPFFVKNPNLYNALSNGGTTGAYVSGTQSNGTMSYNSLQAVLQKQMTKGLQYQVSYTYSKCMSDSTGYYGAWSNALSASAYWQNVYDRHAEWAPCYYDATHVLTAYAIYELPFGRGKALGHDMNKVVNAVVGGWQVAPIITFRTGWPLPVGGLPTTPEPIVAVHAPIAMVSHVLREKPRSLRPVSVDTSGSPTTATSPTPPTALSAIALRSSPGSAVRTTPMWTWVWRRTSS